MTSYTSEAQHFSGLAEYWWDPEGELKTLHVINPLRLKYTHDAVNLANKRVLDVGCGGGIFTEAMARRSARVTGIDISHELIQIARDHAKSQDLDIEYKTSTIEGYAIENSGTFDVITCLELLEHVDDPVSTVRTMAQLLVPGGDMILSTINRTVSAYLKTVLIAEYIINLIPRHTHRYEKFIRPSELTGWLRDAGLTLVDVTGLAYVPILDYACLTDNPAVNYLVHARNEN